MEHVLHLASYSKLITYVFYGIFLVVGWLFGSIIMLLVKSMAYTYRINIMKMFQLKFVVIVIVLFFLWILYPPQGVY